MLSGRCRLDRRASCLDRLFTVFNAVMMRTGVVARPVAVISKLDDLTI